MKKVLAFGTFDILHPGHENYLKQAKTLGDFLVVVVARDETVKKIKGKEPENPEDIRLTNVQNLKIADLVVLGHLGNDHYKIIEEIKPDIMALGYDQNNFITENLEKELKRRNLNCQIFRLKPFHPEKYKTSLLKKKKGD